MRRVLAVAAAVSLVACAQSESSMADSAAMAPAALTADMVVGTWNGVSMAEGSDSVVGRWTAIRTAEGAKLVSEGSTDTILTTAVFDGDSAISTSQPYTPAEPAGSPEMMWRSVMRLVDGKLVGQTAFMLTAKPDSVVSRVRFEATRQP